MIRMSHRWKINTTTPSWIFWIARDLPSNIEGLWTNGSTIPHFHSWSTNDMDMRQTRVLTAPGVLLWSEENRGQTLHAHHLRQMLLSLSGYDSNKASVSQSNFDASKWAYFCSCKNWILRLRRPREHCDRALAHLGTGRIQNVRSSSDHAGFAGECFHLLKRYPGSWWDWHDPCLNLAGDWFCWYLKKQCHNLSSPTVPWHPKTSGNPSDYCINLLRKGPRSYKMEYPMVAVVGLKTQ